MTDSTNPPPTVKEMSQCNCAAKAPTAPTYRDPMEHLADCPARDSGYPVGMVGLARTPRPDKVGTPPCHFCGERQVHKEGCFSMRMPRRLYEASPIDSPSLSDMRDSPQEFCPAADFVAPKRNIGWLCTLPAGHSGDHEAHGFSGNLYHSWPQTPVPKSGDETVYGTTQSEQASIDRATDSVPLSEMEKHIDSVRQRAIAMERALESVGLNGISRVAGIESALQSIESFVTALIEENKRLREDLDKAILAEIPNQPQLTPEEAAQLLAVLNHRLPPEKDFDKQLALFRSAESKLRSLGTLE